MSKSIWIVVIALLVIIVGYMFFAQAPETSAPAPTTTPATQENTGNETVPTLSSGEETTPTVTTPSESAPVKELTVEGTEFAYNVKTITVTPGQKIKITLMNKGSMIHDLDIDGVVDSPIIAAGEQEVIEFTAPAKAGSYEYYCSVGSHRQQGMKGQLVVQ